MELHKNFDHFRLSLRVNQKNILGEYSSFVKSSTCNYLQLDWINLHRNDFVLKRPVTSVSTCCLANSSWKSYTLQPLNSVSFGKALHRRETHPNKIHSVSTLNITQEECEKLQRVQAQERKSKGGASMFLAILHMHSTIIVNHVHCQWLHDNIMERLHKSTGHTPRSKERWTR